MASLPELVKKPVETDEGSGRRRRSSARRSSIGAVRAVQASTEPFNGIGFLGRKTKRSAAFSKLGFSELKMRYAI